MKHVKLKWLVSASNAGEVIDKSYWGDGDEPLYTCARDILRSDFSAFPKWKRTTSDDLLLTRNGTPYIHIPVEGAIYSNVVQRISVPSVNKYYLRYALEDRVRSFRGYGVSIESLNYEMWSNLEVALPDLATQRQIADFLDRETARIDLLIEKKQRLVALLGEKLQAKISSLVKGSSPTNVVRLRHVLRLNPSARHLRLASDAPVAFCPMDSIEDGVGGIDVSNIRPLSVVSSASYNFFADGDILLAKVTPCFENGKKALARKLTNGVGFATSEVFVIRPDLRQVFPEYLIYLFSSDEFQYSGRSSMTGAGGLRRISDRSILDFPLFVTELHEQRKIVTDLDADVAISRKIVAKTNTSIDRLKEYRSALITAAVTGQIDVSTYAKSGTPDRRLDAIQEEMGA